MQRTTARHLWAISILKEQNKALKSFHEGWQNTWFTKEQESQCIRLLLRNNNGRSRRPLSNVFKSWGKTYFFKDFIYLFIRDTEREAETHSQREKQALGREPNAGTWSQESRIRPWAKDRQLNRWTTEVSCEFWF